MVRRYTIRTSAPKFRHCLLCGFSGNAVTKLCLGSGNPSKEVDLAGTIPMLVCVSTVKWLRGITWITRSCSGQKVLMFIFGL